MIPISNWFISTAAKGAEAKVDSTVRTFRKYLCWYERNIIPCKILNSMEYANYYELYQTQIIRLHKTPQGYEIQAKNGKSYFAATLKKAGFNPIMACLGSFDNYIIDLDPQEDEDDDIHKKDIKHRQKFLFSDG